MTCQEGASMLCVWVAVQSPNRRACGRNVAGRVRSHGSWLQHPCSAAHTAQQPRRAPRAVATAYRQLCLGGTLGTLQPPKRTLSISPSDLLLTLDAPSAGSTDKVLWDVIRMQTRSRNMCFVKSGRFPVHLGLDHAETESQQRQQTVPRREENGGVSTVR